MRIEAIELRRIRLPYRSPFETSGWREEANHSVIVTLHSEGAIGWGEAPVGAGPWYNEETQATAWVMMREILAPMLLGRDLSQPEEVDAIFARVRGNRMARAGLEFAAWDLFGRARGESLSAMLGGTRQRVEVGVSVGVQPSIEALLEVVEGYVSAGYQRVKLKIKPGWDVEPTRAVRERWPDLRLQVDANSIYTLDQAAQLAKLDEFDLLLIEQPLAHDDIIDHAKLQRQLRTPICLDESIVSPDHARWAIELRACGVINIKPSRVGGFTAARQIHDMAQAAGIPVWCGGMLETGIGRAANVGLASLPNFSLPGDISANDRYFHHDIVTNPFTLNPDSTLTVPTGPGSGAEVDLERLQAVTLDYAMLKA
ncbi:o-succinylbenzoate synthase [Chloroflexus sp.]|uniref:o-succinylbenzoate synthase n=1 Tax=Chloroflexus sp. TaxID=1904827 RepID=UPI00298EF1FE|nr:o-succinylbenzoate synthase [Chloroflexus sp.]MCS6888796.1 o-succinylbenzoate synthase [Chloroflexus sp.]MCX7860180.1 o-succinylbenzoate synthase [Chloroflexus sp.]MDW8404261.1 o-succinylbenzoate synthase [Chloroflexus sp.]